MDKQTKQIILGGVAVIGVILAMKLVAKISLRRKAARLSEGKTIRFTASKAGKTFTVKLGSKGGLLFYDGAEYVARVGRDGNTLTWNTDKGREIMYPTWFAGIQARFTPNEYEELLKLMKMT